MIFTYAQGVDITLIFLAVLYLVFAKVKLHKIMPIVNQVLHGPVKDRTLEKNSIKLIVSIPFSWLCFWFVMYRFHVLLDGLGVDFYTALIIPILLSLYGAYIIFFSTTFGLVASNYKRPNMMYEDAI